MSSNLPNILNEIDVIIRQKTTIDSITPTDVAHCLDEVARYASSAYPIPLFTNGSGNISDPDLIGMDILSITFNGGEFLKGIHYTKNVGDQNVVYINPNSLPPNILVLLKAGDGSTNGDSTGFVIGGSFTASGDGATAIYHIPHTMAAPYIATVTAGNAVAAEAGFFVAAENTNLLDVVFLIDIPTGVDNIKLNYQLKKL